MTPSLPYAVVLEPDPNTSLELRVAESMRNYIDVPRFNYARVALPPGQSMVTLTTTLPQGLSLYFSAGHETGVSRVVATIPEGERGESRSSEPVIVITNNEKGYLYVRSSKWWTKPAEYEEKLWSSIAVYPLPTP